MNDMGGSRRLPPSAFATSPNLDGWRPEHPDLAPTFAGWIGDTLAEEYGNLFHEGGFDSMEVLLALTEAQVHEMLEVHVPIVKPGHRMFFLNRLNAAREDEGRAPHPTTPNRTRLAHHHHHEPSDSSSRRRLTAPLDPPGYAQPRLKADASPTSSSGRGAYRPRDSNQRLDDRRRNIEASAAGRVRVGASTLPLGRHVAPPDEEEDPEGLGLDAAAGHRMPSPSPDDIADDGPGGLAGPSESFRHEAATPTHQSHPPRANPSARGGTQVSRAGPASAAPNPSPEEGSGGARRRPTKTTTTPAAAAAGNHTTGRGTGRGAGGGQQQLEPTTTERRRRANSPPMEVETTLLQQHRQSGRLGGGAPPTHGASSPRGPTAARSGAPQHSTAQRHRVHQSPESLLRRDAPQSPPTSPTSRGRSQLGAMLRRPGSEGPTARSSANRSTTHAQQRPQQRPGDAPTSPRRGDRPAPTALLSRDTTATTQREMTPSTQSGASSLLPGGVLSGPDSGPPSPTAGFGRHRQNRQNNTHHYPQEDDEEAEEEEEQVPAQNRPSQHQQQRYRPEYPPLPQSPVLERPGYPPPPAHAPAGRGGRPVPLSPDRGGDQRSSFRRERGGGGGGSNSLAGTPSSDAPPSTASYDSLLAMLRSAPAIAQDRSIRQSTAGSTTVSRHTTDHHPSSTTTSPPTKAGDGGGGGGARRPVDGWSTR